MTDVWILIHLAFIQILFNRKRCTMSLWCFLLPFLVPTLAAPNRTAVINVYKAEKPTSRPQLSSTIKTDHAIAENVRGKYSELGNVKETNGRLHMVTRTNIDILFGNAPFKCSALLPYMYTRYDYYKTQYSKDKNRI